jgi:hypothetical protein
VALQVHALAKINRAKYSALGRLYHGLKVMTILTAGLITAMAVLALRSPDVPDARPSSGVQQGQQPGRDTTKETAK